MAKYVIGQLYTVYNRKADAASLIIAFVVKLT